MKAGRRGPCCRPAIRVSGRGGAILLEVLLAIAILILGMAAVGSQVNVGMRVAGDCDTATRAVMLAKTVMSQLDSGEIPIVPNDELEDDFRLYPGWGFRIYVDPSENTEDLNMVTVQILYKPGVAYRETPEYQPEDVIYTCYTLRATPANINVSRDFGFDLDDLSAAGGGTEGGGSGPGGGGGAPANNQLAGLLDLINQIQSLLPEGFDLNNLPPDFIRYIPPDQLAGLLEVLKQIPGFSSLLGGSVGDQLREAMDGSGDGGGRRGGPGRGDAERDGDGEDRGDAGMLPGGPEAGGPRRGGGGRERDPDRPGDRGADRGDRRGPRGGRPDRSDGGRRGPDREGDDGGPRVPGGFDRGNRSGDTGFGGGRGMDRRGGRNGGGNDDRGPRAPGGFDRGNRSGDTGFGGGRGGGPGRNDGEMRGGQRVPRAEDLGGGMGDGFDRGGNRPGRGTGGASRFGGNDAGFGRGGGGADNRRFGGQGDAGRRGNATGADAAPRTRLPSRDGLNDRFRPPTERDLYGRGGRQSMGR